MEHNEKPTRRTRRSFLKRSAAAGVGAKSALIFGGLVMTAHASSSNIAKCHRGDFATGVTYGSDVPGRHWVQYSCGTWFDHACPKTDEWACGYTEADDSAWKGVGEDGDAITKCFSNNTVEPGILCWRLESGPW